MYVHQRAGVVLCLLGIASGCGGGIEEFDRAPVTGVVLCKGEPVPLARVAFNPLKTGDTPVVGKQGLGLTDVDGTFTLSTYDENDGAVIGKHSVRVWMDGSDCDCAVGDTLEVEQVEVEGGKENHFEIVLREATAEEQRAQAVLVEEFLDD